MDTPAAGKTPTHTPTPKPDILQLEQGTFGAMGARTTSLNNVENNMKPGSASQETEQNGGIINSTLCSRKVECTLAVIYLTLAAAQACNAVFAPKYHGDHEHEHEHEHMEQGWFDGTIASILRRTGHGIESLGSAAAGIATIGGLLFGTPGQTSKFKLCANISMGIGSLGTLLAAIGDAGSQDYDHATLHFIQFATTLLSSLPSVFIRKAAPNSGEPSDTTTRNQIIKRALVIAGSAGEAAATFKLAHSMGSPFYIMEGTANIAFAVVNCRLLADVINQYKRNATQNDESAIQSLDFTPNSADKSLVVIVCPSIQPVRDSQQSTTSNVISLITPDDTLKEEQCSFISNSNSSLEAPVPSEKAPGWFHGWSAWLPSGCLTIM
ncbi:hypothetical protein [uncultured Endozoicomonas sp.]|uniref:hypothetical protein n=1 Tax=uncultured Endozoicomonas sp. TaxID=432652 RepID=UPI002622913D|nr:hypothetical protein [uncultured Endozoicomonas sp.]